MRAKHSKDGGRRATAAVFPDRYHPQGVVVITVCNYLEEGDDMRRMTTWLVSFAMVLALGACEADRMSEKGFSLPEGNALNGREAFVYMHCHECHTVAGEEFPELAMADPPFVQLGGNVTRVKTYGQLVTAIINPSHKLAQGYPAELVSNEGESMMPVYNGYMTVQELIDIVAFLQPHYNVYVPQYEYRVYP